ncbi:MAG: alpha/beta hydrolase [Gammaproteobacteria bacterium]|jgi:alpha/beta superfamily hydrolase
MTRATADSEKMTFSGPAGTLEGILDHPAEVTPRAIAVVCHPHPQFQGTMTNKVAHMLARSFNALGAVTLRFNFRGVGRSEGTYDEGRGEVEDAIAAAGWMRRRWPDTRLWLGGFSFGAQVALRASARIRPDWIVTVAPPVQRFIDDPPPVPDCPWLLLQGQDDELVDARQVVDWAKHLEPAPDIVLFPDTSHFFHGKLTDLRRAVVDRVPAGVGG